jgi:hypothetical protein
MTQRIRQRIPQAALVISIVALVAALGGGAYAAVKLKSNSVKTKTIKNKAVTGAKLADVVVRTADSAATGDADGSTNAGAVGKTGVITASCQGKERLIDGGAKWSAGNSAAKNVYISESYPEGNSWKAEGIHDGGASGNATLQVIAVCLK